MTSAGPIADGRGRRKPAGRDAPGDWRGYQLEEVVERGGRLVTYRATRSDPATPAQAGAVGRQAIRTLLVRTAGPGIRPGPELVRALAREADWLEQLGHPLVPRLLERCLDAEAPGLVLEDAGGVRLDVVIDRGGPLERAPALAIGIEVARVLSAMHRQGKTHGRLRPCHVELCPDGTVRLHGIGAASRPGGEELDDDLSLGPDELAPEQVSGLAIDARTDVYLLGLLLRHATAHEHEHEGTGDRRRRSRGLPVGKSGVLLNPAGRSLLGEPPSLDDVLSACLQQRPRDRVQDAGLLAAWLVASLRADTTAPTELLIGKALSRAGLGEPQHDALGGFPGLRRRLRARTRRYLLAAAVASLALGALAAWRLAGPRRAAEMGADGVRGVEQRAAELRVLAQPWADVYVDGKLVDTTPIGRPIVVSPGRHEVRFRHPNAPDQLRTVEVIGGQTVWLDVAMPVVRPTAPATADAAAESP